MGQKTDADSIAHRAFIWELVSFPALLPNAAMIRQEQRQRVEEQQRLCSLARELLPRREPPYFGHMRLSNDHGRTDVLLALEARADPRVTIIDWRTSPLAEVFFGCDEGEPYEITVAGRALTGALVERSMVRFGSGEIVEVASRGARLVRQPSGDWEEVAESVGPRLSGRTPGQRGGRGPRVDFELDPAQRRVVEMPAGQAVLVLGEAGCGKTTVALHRLARLKRAGGKLRAAVVVPTDGLRRLTELLLARLGVPGVEVWLYDRWAAEQAHRAFPDLPRRESCDASAAVIRLKRHPAIRFALEEIAGRPPALPEEDEPTVRSSAFARRHDLQHLFGDRAVLERASAREGGALSQAAIADAFEHTRVQFSRTTEDEYAHVDRERLSALDGRSLDDGTPTQDAASLDVEDYAVLFELDRLRAERAGAAPTAPLCYDCIVLDEAQELAPLELKLVGRCLSPGGTLVVAGDAEQQIDPAASFLGWPATMGALGAGAFTAATLEVSYRCPPEVTAFARGVLDPARASHRPARNRALALARFDSDCHLAAWLVDALRELQEKDRAASVAVVWRTAEGARRLFPVVRHGVIARLALDGNFAFTAGVNLSCVPEVKGLEFEVVIVPDASVESYSDTPEARRALYLASTRPTRQLVVASVGEPSPLAARP